MEGCIQYIEDLGWLLRCPHRQMSLNRKRKWKSLFQVHGVEFRVSSNLNPTASEFSLNNRQHPLRERTKRQIKTTHDPHVIDSNEITYLNPLASEFVPSISTELHSPDFSSTTTDIFQMENIRGSPTIGFISDLTENELKSRINEEFENFSGRDLDELFELFTESDSCISGRFRCGQNVANSFFQVFPSELTRFIL